MTEVKKRVGGNRSILRFSSIGSPIVGNPKPTIQIDCEPNSYILGTHDNNNNNNNNNFKKN